MVSARLLGLPPLARKAKSRPVPERKTTEGARNSTQEDFYDSFTLRPLFGMPQNPIGS
jgi:hypothetical protein